VYIFRGLLLIAGIFLVWTIVHDLSASHQQRINNVEQATTSLEEMQAELKRTQSDLEGMKREAAIHLDAMEAEIKQLQSDLDTRNSKNNHEL